MVADTALTGRCAVCSEEHHFAELEPSFGVPDVVFALPKAERREQVTLSKNLCVWRVPFGRRCFVRTLLPLPVAGRLGPLKWGIWVEMGRSSFGHLIDAWDSPACTEAGPWTGSLANAIQGIPDTLGLQGKLRFGDESSIPTFTLDDHDHVLVKRQRDGITEAEALEWMMKLFHPE